MPVAIVTEWDVTDHDTAGYDATVERMGVVDDPPDGCLVHTAGFSDEGTWRVFDVWESQEHCDRFMRDRLMPAAAELPEGSGGPPTRVSTYELHGYFAP